MLLPDPVIHLYWAHALARAEEMFKETSFPTGMSLSSKQWGRPNDTVGIAPTVNRISSIHQDFLNAGGLGILVGDTSYPIPALNG